MRIGQHIVWVLSTLILIVSCDRQEPTGHHSTPLRDLHLGDLLLPTDRTFIGDVPVIRPSAIADTTGMIHTGTVQFDPRSITMVSARVAGRIERLHVNSNFHRVQRGDRLLELYSPEIANAQKELIHILRTEGNEHPLAASARQKLILLGVASDQVQRLDANSQTDGTFTITSPASGIVQDAIQDPAMGMEAPAAGNSLLALREGQYVTMGQALLSIYDPQTLWVELRLTGSPKDHSIGDTISLSTVGSRSEQFVGIVSSVDPAIEAGSDLTVVRLTIPRTVADKLRPGELVQATVPPAAADGLWVPDDAVITLGASHAVFIRDSTGTFHASAVNVTDRRTGSVRLEGIDQDTWIARRPLLLIDNDSYIHVEDTR